MNHAQPNPTYYFSDYNSPCGILRLLASERGLAALYFEQHRHQASWAKLVERGTLRVLQQAQFELDAYFHGKIQTFTVPLDVSQASVFQRTVWAALQTIPYGETRSYAALAEQIGHHGAARAVGSANARNPLSIIVPCHRVIASNGDLSGYAGGLERKKYLLNHEKKIEKAI